MSKSIVTYMTFLFSLVCVLITVSFKATLTSNNNRTYVQATCDWSRTHSEASQRCADAQAKTHTEYLCVTNTRELNCWVETK